MGHDMEWKGKYKSELLMVCHMDAKAMHDVGVISDKEMQEYDRDCLVHLSETTVSGSTNTLNQKSTPAYASSKRS